MSARQQAGQLRSILARNFKKFAVRETAANTLKATGQVASGNAVQKILQGQEERMFSISFSIDKELDAIYDISITYDFDRLEVDYYRRIDRVLGRDRANPAMRVSTDAIYKWIGQKIRNGTWKGAQSYTMTRTRRGVSKQYTYPLSKLIYRRALAFVIARTINEDQRLENRSPYITRARTQVTKAVNQSEKEFYDLWENDLATNLESKITALF